MLEGPLIVLPVVYEWLGERWPDWARALHYQVTRRRKSKQLSLREPVFDDRAVSSP